MDKIANATVIERPVRAPAIEPRRAASTTAAPPTPAIMRAEHPEGTLPNPLLEGVKAEPAVAKFTLPDQGDFTLGRQDRWRPRAVTEADLDGLIEWGLPKFQQRYPRCTAQSVLPFLRLACHSPHFHFVMTSDAASLWMAERSAWEPELTVFDIAVAARQRADTKSQLPGWQVLRHYQSGLDWARRIGAVAFKYGTDTGYSIAPFAERIGYDVKAEFYTKLLR